MAAFRNNFPLYDNQQNNQFTQNQFANNRFAQNVPRGTFPMQMPQQPQQQHFQQHSHNHNQNSGQRQYPQQMGAGRQTQRQMMNPQMQARQQMPMVGQHQGQGMQSARNMPGMMNMPNQPNMGNVQNTPQMPPMQLLNPTNDPHVRFEPIGDNMQGAAQTMPVAPPGNAPSNIGQANQNAQPFQTSMGQAAMGDAITQRLANLLQGEGNSIVFYGNLVKARGTQAREKQLINELIETKRRQLRYTTEMYKGLANSEWGGTEMMTQQIGDLREGISYALLQESRLLREASQIYADMGTSAAQGGMLTVLHSKIADIAHLMAI